MIKRENKTYKQIFLLAVDMLDKNQKFSIKTLQSGLKIEKSTAVKVVAGLFCMGAVSQIDEKNYEFFGDKVDVDAVRDKQDLFENYFFIKEDDKFFGTNALKTYLSDVLMHAIKLGVLSTSLSLIFMQKKMGLSGERAREIFDILHTINFIENEVDFYAPNRQKFCLGYDGYDRLYDRVEKL